jgi:hypothetical protein
MTWAQALALDVAMCAFLLFIFALALPPVERNDDEEGR